MKRAIYIPAGWELPDAIRMRLGESVGKQRLIHEAGHLLLLLHQVPEMEDDEVRAAAVFWRDSAGEWKSSPVGGGLAGLEDAPLLVSPRHPSVGRCGGLRQNRAALLRCDAPHATLAAVNARHAQGHAGHTRGDPEDTRIITLRDQASDLERAIELIAADAKAGMDFTLAEAASQQALPLRWRIRRRAA